MSPREMVWEIYNERRERKIYIYKEKDQKRIAKMIGIEKKENEYGGRLL